MPGNFSSPRNSSYKPLLAGFCAFALIWTMFLLYAGGFTTSIQAGMAFLDWPLSDGSINPPGWLTEADKRAEHSHRLLGAIVGMLTVALAIWIYLRESRRWLHWLSLFAVFLVVFQGVLGGMRVRFDWLNTGADHNLAAQAFAVVHACLAQVFLCVLVSLAVGLSRPWIRGGRFDTRRWSMIRVSGYAACATIFIQLIFGAVMRHSHAGLAIPTFPLTPTGGLLPAIWSFPVAIHFAHRAWALVVVAAIVWFACRLWSARSSERVFGIGAGVLGGMIALQVYLGALVIWTARNPHAATIHMLLGAFLLAVCWSLTFLSERGRIERSATDVSPVISAIGRHARA